MTGDALADATMMVFLAVILLLTYALTGSE